MAVKAEEKPTGLALLREPFPPHQISKLPKPTKQQTEEVRANFKAGIRCEECGAWHHPKVVHLDYVGHAALTDRLLECDAQWNWTPFALDSRGLPAKDEDGGLWINLTVCGVTRPGYGSADGKQGGDAVKELIGDALRNAAMRFGAALDLWHKGDLHVSDDETPPLPQTGSARGRNDAQSKAENPFDEPASTPNLSGGDNRMIDDIFACKTIDQLRQWRIDNGEVAEKSDNADRIQDAYRSRLDQLKAKPNPLTSG